jgi:hypothetical protein
LILLFYFSSLLSPLRPSSSQGFSNTWHELGNVLLTMKLQSTASMSLLQVSTELAGWVDVWLQVPPAEQHWGMSLVTQSLTVKPARAHRCTAWVQNSPTMAAHCDPIV